MWRLRSAGASADGVRVDPTRTPTAPVRQREIRPLTGFRWVIGLALFLHHAVNYHLFATRGADWSPDDLSWQQLLHQGTAAVAFFFLLSGFTLTWNYAAKFRTLQARGVTRFYVNRIASIWPIHLLAFGMFSIFFVDDLLANPAQVLTVALPAILLLQAWIPLAGPDTWTLGFNGPSWSLSALLFFYALFPVLIALLGRMERARPRLTIALPVAAVAGTALLAWAWAGDPYASWLFHTYPPLRLVDFVVGICACLVLLRSARAGLPAALPGGRLGATLIESATVLLLVVMAFGHEIAPLAVRYSSWYVLPLAAMVYAFARGGGLLSAALGTAPLVWLGRISFPFLMLHVVVMQALSSAGIYAQSAWLAGVVAFVLSFALAVATHKLWESPARRFIRARGSAWLDARFDAASRDAEEDAAAAAIQLEATRSSDERAA
ncbi:MAG: acyltransferase 3 [Thermoleophilia bacterium]|nr:acyltransferase 3 [Thermoleophilia bacterium]